VRAVSVLSTHPVVAIALGEAAGQVLEALDGARPTVVVATVTPPHLGTLEDVGGALRALLAPDVVVGAVTSAVIGAGRQVDEGPGLSLFALTGVPASPLSLALAPDGGLVPEGGLSGATAAVVLADPFSCSSSALVAALGDVPGGGGLVGGPRGPGGSRLLLGTDVRTEGAVGALLGAPAQVLASQGGTPIGDPWVVTRSDARFVLELGGMPASLRLHEAMGEHHREAALGLVLDDRADDPDRTQLLAVPIRGQARDGGLRVAQPIPVGEVVRFLRIGPSEVEADLVAALAPFGPRPRGALLFPTEGREGDADVVSELLGCPVGGAAVLSALAPVAGRGSLHGSGASSVVLFP
jgi:small ligand-binding sensory domain FIST